MSDEEGAIYARSATGLIREVGIFSVISIAACFTIADGFYWATFQAFYQNPGADMIVAMILGGSILIFSALALAFLTAAMPRSGGEYVAISRTVHPLVGYFESWMTFQAHLIITGALAFFSVFFLGDAIYFFGVMTNNPGLIATGSYLATDAIIEAVLGIVIVIIFFFLTAIGMRYYSAMINILFIIPLIGAIITVFVVLGFVGNPAAVQAAWDATYGTGAYQEVINVAIANGYNSYYPGGGTVYGFPGPSSLGATGGAIIATSYACWGYATGNTVSGEIKEPSRTFLKGTLVSIVIILGFYLVALAGATLAYGQFISYVQFNAGSGAYSNYTINPQLEPSFALYAASLVGGTNPAAGFIITITAAIWVLNDVPVFLLVTSRMIFAWAFDRMFPLMFATVSERFHTPINAIALVAILSVVWCLWAILDPFALIVVSFGTVIFRYILGGLACAVMPYTKPNLYERGYTWTLGTIPVATIIGILTLITHAPLFWLCMVGVFSYPPLAAWTVGVMILSVVLYFIFKYRNERIGIDINKVYADLPPE